MANQEHLDILKQGVEAWNQWRKDHPAINPDLREADLREAIIGWTTFANIDLSTVKGLETVKHLGPSTIGIDTVYLSSGNIPEGVRRFV